MKNFLAAYILFNLIAYGLALSISYNRLVNNNYSCEASEVFGVGAVAVGLALFMAENSPMLEEKVEAYCEALSTKHNSL